MPAALCGAQCHEAVGEAPDCALGVGGSVHQDAGIGREDGGGWIVLHGASMG